ncbi:MAG: restriction endonuclease subunit S, partial [Gammaproteobacteria bacterium]|nr:restriction endonuclease subunit S [Gammaproteobacteria bacterium]
GRWIAKSPAGEDLLVRPGAVLVAAQGTLGESELYCRSEFIWGKRLENAYSEHLLRVIADEDIMLSGCLFAFMRSESVFRMLRSISTGTKLQNHHPVFLHDLPVPCPPRPVQEQIHQVVIEAYEKRQRAIEFEDEAIALVESAIEQADRENKL